MRDRSHSVKQDNVGKLDITIRSKNLSTDNFVNNANIEISTGVFVLSDGAGMTAKDLISDDADNDLQLGSDDKLLSKPKEVDFLAYYILASN